MTLDQVIQMADSIKLNTFPANAKTEWVNECEGMVQTQVMLFAIEEVITYDYERDKSKELLVLPPHSKIYWAYVCAMIDFANGEYDKYANSMQMFNAFFGEYMRWFAKVYRPADTHAGTIEDEKFWKGYYLTAYGLAVKHGYTGSESEWVDMIGGHPAKKDNPHEVTAEQVGTYKKAEIDAKTAPFEEHLKDFSNPHLVTSEQIGTYSKAEIDAQAEVTAKALEDANSEIAAKLTKITESYPTDRVYGVNMAGEQVMLEAHRDFNSDGGIPVYDNNGVIKTGTPAKDTDSVNKKYVDDKAVGKLDKVKSDFILYPGIYATTDTDGTPYLIIATSNLGYIGKGSGYIATYDGGELKTGTPTSDDSAANKAYVDEKIKVSDVKVAGTSVVADGTANIPNVLALGDDGKLRVANAPDKTKWTGPFGVDNTGLLVTAGPNNIVIDNRTASSIQLLNCAYLDYAVKAAMCDGKGAAWTDTEKAAARERMGIKDYKLLATLNFTENASTFTLTTLNGQPIALKSMVVIMNRIGDGESANGHITPVFTVKGANGASTTIKGGYFYGVGANGNCWYTRADISGEFFGSESACMAPSTNSQLGNGWMTTELSKNMDWRNLSDDFLPITQITGFKITASGNCITNGSTMWIYGKEE